MTPMKSRNRSRPYFVAFVLVGAAFAGCTGQNDEPPADDAEDDGAMEKPEEYAPAPRGTAPTATDLASLAAVFSDQPLIGGQEPWPAHLTKWVNEDAFLLLHFDNDQPLLATKLHWVGVGVKGVFCAEDQPGPGFTHFHQYEAATYEAGHGGQANDEGYWLLHLAVDEDAGADVGVGTDYGFGPTPPPTCGAGRTAADFSPAGAGALSATDIAGLNAVFDDQPLSDSQSPWPEHSLKWLNADVFALLHWNEADPADATALHWFGIGKRSTFCQDTQGQPDFTHFHSYEAADYASGHGGGKDQPGYWLLHVAVHDFTAPWGPVSPGVDLAFMPTPAPPC